jgi:hypothetical protein
MRLHASIEQVIRVDLRSPGGIEEGESATTTAY